MLSLSLFLGSAERDASAAHTQVPSRDVFDEASRAQCQGQVGALLQRCVELDREIEPKILEQGHTFNKYWGYLTRAGHDDKTHLQRQIEKYADIYCARVTNLHSYTPYHYWRAAGQLLAHEIGDLEPATHDDERDI